MSDKKYQRKYNNRIERVVKCPVCGKTFKTYYQHKKNCSPECRTQYRRDQALKYHYEHPEWAKEKRKRAWRKNKKKEYLKHREWVTRNRDKIKGYQAKDKEVSRQRWKEWSQTARGRLITRAIKYRRRQKDFPKIPKKISDKRLTLFDGCCFCKINEPLTLEHLIPLAKDGTNKEHNLFGSCKRCNSSKHMKDWKKWYREQGFYDPIREKSIELAFSQ